MTKRISKNSPEYQRNLKRQLELIAAGYNIKADGSWGPYLARLYNQLQALNLGNWFTRAMLRAAFNENPAVMTAAGWTPQSDGTVKQDAFNTPERNQLADNLALIGNTPIVAQAFAAAPLTFLGSTAAGTAVNAGSVALNGKTWGENINSWTNGYVPTFIGEAANPGFWAIPATLYAQAIAGRYKLANMPMANQSAIRNAILRVFRKGKDGQVNTLQPNGTGWYSTNGDRLEIIPEGTLKSLEGTMVKVGGAKQTTELHENPAILIDENSNIIGAEHNDPSRHLGMDFIKQAPSGTVISADRTAQIPSLYIPYLPWKNRMAYYLFNNTGLIPKLSEHTYSTDILKGLTLLEKRGKGQMIPSTNRNLKGINMFGKSYSEFENHVPVPNDEGEILFSEFTPEQRTWWNTNIAPKYGHVISPNNTVAEGVFVTK